VVTRFLVTGATGFIGSALVRRLTAGGNDVVAPRRDELDLLATSESDLAQFVEKKGISYCIHAAWYTNHADYLTNPINRDWLAASLRLARACRDIRFIGLGTCLEHEPRPATLYAQCKRDLGLGLSDYRMNYAWAFVFFVYGPGDREGRLIPGMVQRFARGERAAPRFGGLRRDYIHVDDLAEQIVRIANSDARGPIEVGTGEAPTLSEIFAAGAAAFGRPDLAEANDETGGDQPLVMQADMTRFRAFIGEPNARDIATGLRDLVG
jgi:nucleoside-diphosphate-sugar epimerase